jgi:hypothetical protein
MATSVFAGGTDSTLLERQNIYRKSFSTFNQGPGDLYLLLDDSAGAAVGEDLFTVIVPSGQLYEVPPGVISAIYASYPFTDGTALVTSNSV